MKIGIIGSSGKMGEIIKSKIESSDKYIYGGGYSNETKESTSLNSLFKNNDIIIDFSSSLLIEEIFKSAISFPKPLIVCTTGWEERDFKPMIADISAKVPLVIVPNTSLGSILQKRLVAELSRVLSNEFDIDIYEKHHREKIDSPSGTAKYLLEEIINIKKNYYDEEYEETIGSNKGARKDHQINVLVARSGNVFGEHEVVFTSLSEQISIKHTAFNRSLFADGAIYILNWLVENNISPGLYRMLDVLKSKLGNNK